ncbi:MAG: hypothetical protein COX07_07970, partial [Bacteroidetes bacterium CG23_combo_of_CG06-09_8_20_14_all_32_9]
SSVKDQEFHTKKLKSYVINGIIGKYYGLPEWFDTKGKLKEEYKKKLTSTTAKPKPQISITKKGIHSRPKAIWAPFVLNTIKEHNTLLQWKELTNIAMKKFKVDYNKANASVLSSLNDQEYHTKKLVSYVINGITGKYYGLPEWFDKKGELKEEYKKKLTSTTAKPKPKPKPQIAVIKKGIHSRPKPIWAPFVLNTIKEHNTLLQRKDLANIAVTKLKIDYNKARESVSSSLKEQEYHTKKLKSYVIDGITGKYYGLPEWFDNKGRLKEEYAKQIK